MKLKIFPFLPDYLAAELRECASILDLGCGNNSPVAYMSPSFAVGVDIHKPALLESKKKQIHSEYICAQIPNIEFKRKSFDAVVMAHVLEHLPKQVGIKLIEKAETWARKKVLVWGPNGYLSQDSYNGNPYQRHVSGWTVQDFESMGFAILGFDGLKLFRGERGRIRFKPFYLFLFLTNISKLVTLSHPALASTLFCTKDLQEG